ncbi:MAG: hypothetical protein M0Z58_02155, partial [Nitrospiraceae bacterium]|nr:hypothetical protein [Nitrospiraceae bacterium]
MGEPLKKEDIRRVIEFYGALGLESLPMGPLPQTEDPEKALSALFHEEIEGCRRCKLSSGRTNIVFGEG